MKQLFLYLFLLLSITAFCQQGDTMSSIEKKQHERDSVISFYKNKRDSITKALLLADTDLIKQNTRINTDYFAQLQKENRDKEKKMAMTKIAIGAGLLAVLVIGLRRKRKK